ncbi:MAG: transposase, partial [Erysipelotrichaceae bacterium]|nr:transposase [Erysipelotrichaceae bacterium]
LLFIASRNTMMKTFNNSLFWKIRKKKGILRNPKDNTYLFRNYKYLNEFGMISTLHTFGRDLKWNPHIHSLIPELVYDNKKKKIKHISHFDYESLRKTWMYEVNRLLLEHFSNDSRIRKLITSSYRKLDQGLYVYAKKDISDSDDDYTKKIGSENVKGCVSYMMRYAGRPAMAESRITYYNKDSDDVSWYYEDHKTQDRIEVKEFGLDLLRKMIIHIPDKGFKMIRYYGFYNNKCQDLLDEIHKLLGNERKIYRNREKRKAELKARLDRLKFRTQMADTYNKDIFRCDQCGNSFYYIYTHNPLEGVSNDREYRQDCIDEMRSMRLSGGGPPDNARKIKGSSACI